MMLGIGGRKVDVRDAKCVDRNCFVFGFDKGSFSQGRGYTRYHTDAKGRRVEKPVCQTRHLHGCPTHSVCAVCRLCSVDPPGAACSRQMCTGTTIALGAP